MVTPALSDARKLLFHSGIGKSLSCKKEEQEEEGATNMVTPDSGGNAFVLDD
jgi:hypothetical protein